MPPQVIRALMFVAGIAGCTACSDVTAASGATLPPPAASALVAQLQCTGTPRGASLECHETSSPSGTGARRALLGQSQVKVRSSNVRYDTTTLVFSFDVQVQNLLAEPIGTPDGTRVSGMKVFYETGPVATSFVAPYDTGTIQVANADGVQNFTRANQPYHFYNQILQPQDSTPRKSWQWKVPRSVNTFSFALRVFTARPSEERIPGALPDSWSMPRSYLDPVNRSPCAIEDAGYCVYDIVDVIFHRNATQEERQAAVDLVSGRLDGGSWATSTYYLRLPTDSSFARVRDAVSLLRALPQVRWVGPHAVTQLTPEYLRPNDGPDWERSTWQVHDSAAGGKNWALEAISAPLAWGCETGSITGKVAVVDVDFHDVPDLQGRIVEAGNLGIHFNGLSEGQDSIDHGTKVAAILAATGNNSQGMAGVLWRASVNTYEIAVLDSSTGKPYRNSNGSVIQDAAVTLEQMVKAAADGASVINMSLGTDWQSEAANMGYYLSPGTIYNPSAETNATRITNNKAVVARKYAQFGEAMNIILTQIHKNPLVVFSAGNVNMDAGWDGYKLAADSFPNNVIVVGGVERAGGGKLRPMTGSVSGTAYQTAYGSLVQIAAPAEAVWTLDHNGPISRPGTSFAAPFVTGVAGLLLSFDPSLDQRAGDLKFLLLQGARNGGRKVVNGPGPDSVPVLDAYESLRAAAARQGAPLCGSMTWAQGGKVLADRGGTPEPLFDAPSGFRFQNLDVFHGGRRIRVTLTDLTTGFTSAEQYFDWQANGTWAAGARQSTPRSAVPDSSAGVTYGRRMLSHDNDTIARITPNPMNPATYSAAILVRPTSASSWGYVTDLGAPDPAPGPWTSGCVMKRAADTTCVYSMNLRASTSQGWTGAYAPTGGRVVAVSSRERYEQRFTDDWVPCQSNTGESFSCRVMERLTGTLGASVYSVDLASRTVRPLPISLDSAGVTSVAVSEDGKQVTYSREYNAIVTRVHRDPTNPTTAEVRLGGGTEKRECRYRTFSLVAGSTVFDREIPCDPNNTLRNYTMSAARAARR